MSEGGMNEEWIDRIAEAVVRKLDERDQINAIAMQVLHLLEAREKADPVSAGISDRTVAAAGSTQHGQGK